ncbi:MAG TPA: hypothetical protein VGC41_04500, partial [Kofleriaceae bacterium]
MSGGGAAKPLGPRMAAYVAFVVRFRWAIIVGSIALTVGAGLVAAKISVLADFSYLLPQSARSVQD